MALTSGSWPPLPCPSCGSSPCRCYVGRTSTTWTFPTGSTTIAGTAVGTDGNLDGGLVIMRKGGKYPSVHNGTIIFENMSLEEKIKVIAAWLEKHG